MKYKFLIIFHIFSYTLETKYKDLVKKFNYTLEPKYRDGAKKISLLAIENLQKHFVFKFLISNFVSLMKFVNKKKVDD